MEYEWLVSSVGTFGVAECVAGEIPFLAILCYGAPLPVSDCLSVGHHPRGAVLRWCAEPQCPTTTTCFSGVIHRPFGLQLLLLLVLLPQFTPTLFGPWSVASQLTRTSSMMRWTCVIN